LHIKKISSRSNPNIKRVCELFKSSKSRKENREFVVEGAKLCDEAIKNKAKIFQCFYTEQSSEKYENLIAKLINTADESFLLDSFVFDKISNMSSSQEVMCICHVLDKCNYVNRIDKEGCYLILDDIQDPQNLGTILRTADAFSVNLVCMSSDCCDVYSPKVIRGTMGSIFRVPFCIVQDLKSFLKNIQEKGVYVYASVPRRDIIGPKNKILGEFKKEHKKSAIVIGNEGRGLREELIEICNETITIPMLGKTESLNAAAAASIMIWEFTKK
jgi:TrmH family RNA methyltransferase